MYPCILLVLINISKEEEFRMKKLILSFVLIFTSCNELNHVKRISNVLDSLHHLASKADREKYIRLFQAMLSFLEPILMSAGP